MATVIIKRRAAQTIPILGGPSGHPYNPTSIAPPTGASGGGTAFVLTGTNFLTATGVLFDGVNCTSFVVVNSTTITGVTPAGALGAATVFVAGPSGCNTRSDLYTYTGSAPTISSLNFALGDPRGGGQSIVITGTNLAGATNVAIGGNNVAPSSSTPTTCTFVLPAHALGAVTVAVTTPGGTSGTLPFTYWDLTQIVGVDSIFDADLGITQAGGNISAWNDQGPAAKNLTGANSPQWVPNAFGAGLHGVQCSSAGPSNFFAASARTFAAGLAWYAIGKTTDARTGNPGAGYTGDPPNPFFGDYFGTVQTEFGSGGTLAKQTLWNVYSGAAWQYNGSAGFTANDGATHMMGVTTTAAGAFVLYGGNTAIGSGTATYGTSPTWSCIARGQDAVTDTANVTFAALFTTQGVISSGDRANAWVYAQQRFGAT